MRASVIYRNGYFLSAELSRREIAEVVIEVTNALNINYITYLFRGNDQVRMDMDIEILDKIT
ncbi:argininosuccinate synthase domain-containing protein [Photorhabdus luminescens]|uniref:argininosuccinate synthase domain-containing protein n=1 Tax=Photorhabdus luminescens TaxID=29488 RepID=UPI0030B82CB4